MGWAKNCQPGRAGRLRLTWWNGAGLGQARPVRPNAVPIADGGETGRPVVLAEAEQQVVPGAGYGERSDRPLMEILNASLKIAESGGDLSLSPCHPF